MSLNKVSSGRDVPNDFNVIIEIPMNADPIKYEVDKESGAIFVDRFMSTAMHYPCNYGYVPNTLSDDGDPCDVLVITPFPLIPGVVVRCRVIGILKMEDEAGGDAKILAVPVDKILPIYKHWQKPEDLNDLRLQQTEWRPESLNLAQRIREHAEQRGISAGQFALAWVLNNALITSAIAGPRTEQQWEDYVPALNYNFTAQDEAFINDLVVTGHSSTPGYNDPSHPFFGRKPLG